MKYTEIVNVVQTDSEKHIAFINLLKIGSRVILLVISVLSFFLLVDGFISDLLKVSYIPSTIFILASLAFFLKFSEDAKQVNHNIANFLSIFIIFLGLLGILSFVGLGNLLNNFENELRFQFFINFAILGFCILTFNNRLFPIARIYHTLGLIMAIFPLFTFISFGYNLVSHANLYPFQDMVISALFLLFTISLLLSRPNHGVLRVLTTPLNDSSTARDMLISAIFIPILLGFFILFGEQFEIFREKDAISIFVVTLVVIFSIFIWWMANLLYEDDIKQIRLYEDLKNEKLQLEQTSKKLNEKIKELEKSQEEVRQLLYHQDKLRDLMD